MNTPASPDAAAWRARAALVRPRADALIDGKHVPAVSGERFAVIRPIDGRKRAEAAACDSAKALRAANGAPYGLGASVWTDDMTTPLTNIRS